MNFAADQFRPPLGDLVTVLLIGAAVVGVLWLYGWRQRQATWWRRGILLLMRLAAVAVVGWMLMGPGAQTMNDRPHTERMPLLIMADTSASMQQPDVPNFSPYDDEDPQQNITRWQAILRTWLEPAYVARLEEKADVRLLAFDRTYRRMSIDEAHTLVPDGEQTRIFESTRHVIESQRSHDEPDRLAGLVVLLSDGHDTQRAVDPTFASHMREAGWRIMTVPIGSPLGVRHITVDASADADFLFENQSTWIHAQVRQGGFENRRVRVELLHEGRLMDSQVMRFGDESSQSLRFRITPPAPQPGGPRTRIEGYKVVAHPLTDDGQVDTDEQAYLDDNHRWVFVQVSSDRIRVAMFESQPYWDTKFLARVLREDPQVELTSVYSLASGRVVTVQSNVQAGRVLGEKESDYDPNWLSLERLQQFDVVILGKGAERFFGHDRAQWLVDYVQQFGGALVMARGQAFNLADPAGAAAQFILQDIEPVEWGIGTMRDLRLRVAPEGRDSALLQFERLGATDAVLSELPDMLAATRIRRERALSVVLLRQAPLREDGTPHMAAIVHRNAGSGRVLAVLSDGMWRWAFLPSNLQAYDSVYQAFWARAIRWLATGGQFLPGQSMSLSLSALRAEPEESVQVTVNTRYVRSPGFRPTVEHIAPDGSVQAVTLTRPSEQSTQYVGSIVPQQAGVHQIVLVGDDDEATGEPMRMVGRLAVHDASPERRDPSAKPQILAEISENTGGICFDLHDREELVRLLEQLREARLSDPTWDYIFNQRDVFILLAVLLGLEWIVRRRGGLV